MLAETHIIFFYFFLIFLTCIVEQLLGGFTMVQLTFFYFICQLYRAGSVPPPLATHQP